MAAILLACKAHLATADSGSLTVVITRPAEGETYYAGPSSLVYNIPVSGWVTRGRVPTEATVRLEVFQGTRLAGVLTDTVSADGAFIFHITVNPDASGEYFPAELKGCDTSCHYRTNMALPQGSVLLRVTAIATSGERGSAERHIKVDHSGYAIVPVHVVLEDNPEIPVGGIPVMASTWIYMWRARHATGITDAQGNAEMRVEALSQSPTRYVFRVESAVVNGVRYEGTTAVEVTLPPGTTSAPPVTLSVRKRMGYLSGTVTGDVGLPPALALWAIRLPEGTGFRTMASGDGTFVFSDLPIGPYLVVADTGMGGASAPAQVVDLTGSPTATISIHLVAGKGETLHGAVRDSEGVPLPFAWITMGETGPAQRVQPDSGSWSLPNVASQSTTLVVRAPGYYSRAQVVMPPFGPPLSLEVQLTRRPETQVVSWGKGQVVVPPETRATIEDHQITLRYGWIWGHGGEEEPLTILTPDVEVAIGCGAFALEQPGQQAAWLYLLEGSATVRRRTGESAEIGPGQMILLTDKGRLSPVALHPVVFAALHPVSAPPIPSVWDPGPTAQLRDHLARMGIGTAQLMTLITYTAMVLSLILLPLVGVGLWCRQRWGKA